MFLKTLQNSQQNICRRKTLVQVLSCEFCEIFKNTFFIEYRWWLLVEHREKSRTQEIKLKNLIFPLERLNWISKIIFKRFIKKKVHAQHSPQASRHNKSDPWSFYWKKNLRNCIAYKLKKNQNPCCSALINLKTFLQW